MLYGAVRYFLSCFLPFPIVLKAELSSEMRGLFGTTEMSEQMMAQNMSTFRNGMADFLNRTAGLFSSSKEKRTFLINNVHHVRLDS